MKNFILAFVLFSICSMPSHAQYGEACGFIGAPPPLREEVELLISENKQWILAGWLYSNDTQKQVYAAEALIRLQHSGLELTDHQIHTIGELKNSDMEVFTCMGCSFYKETMKTALYKFQLKE
ncbi:MAG: hypothetical protein QNK23_11825 [Crocinitomicaceae bacterium]|nr:hypothetical protein [Crocinitomicaceae bacterium]